ncbi:MULTISPECIES: helix-turn-helix domain-containing protein [Sphingomonadaceae]|uniref:helix-turn-helix domain-containing protein n=1 Tax=Sphingomonadaceae TaxID=41297 RepID=UPI001159F675|nr:MULTISPECIES: helix-turn-helix domain-containing protein [Sphingomonadaceae]QDK34465.1 AraC family transcriptional regulator [Sphingomonas sp. IC081]QSR16725.1 AraC family transcriptional regulator [Novosphingobium sp. KA1]
MLQRSIPAVDPALAPEQGFARNGQPLSYNRAPAVDLAPWIARLYVSRVAAPAGYTLSCGLFSDTATLRIQIDGKWTAKAADGEHAFEKAALFLGPQTHRMPITVTGSFTSVGIAFRPGACTAMQGPRISDYVDRLVSTSAVSIPSECYLAMLGPDGCPEAWLQRLEQTFRHRIEQMDCPPPDPVTARFETITYRSPSITVADAARECGVERRTLERVVNRDFGMSPKQVLRRARALDMASYLRGVVDAEEADEIALRYYDESHLIHEFTELFGMSPSQFVKRPQPILTLILEARQARRLEMLKRLQPGQTRPWQ